MSAVIIRTALTGLRNGLPETPGYRYQGTGKDVLTAWMDDPRLRPLCGRLMPYGQVCGRREGHTSHCKGEEAMARDRSKSRQRRTAPPRQRRTAPRLRCDGCGYTAGSPNCRVLCGSTR